MTLLKTAKATLWYLVYRCPLIYVAGSLNWISGLNNGWIFKIYVTCRRELTPYVMSLLAPSDPPKMRLVIYLKGDHKFFHQGFPALKWPAWGDKAHRSIGVLLWLNPLWSFTAFDCLFEISFQLFYSALCFWWFFHTSFISLYFSNFFLFSSSLKCYNKIITIFKKISEHEQSPASLNQQSFANF